jgi:hypothetical protein
VKQSPCQELLHRCTPTHAAIKPIDLNSRKEPHLPENSANGPNLIPDEGKEISPLAAVLALKKKLDHMTGD